MVGIVCATYWEVRQFIQSCRLGKSTGNRFSGQLGDNSVCLFISGIGQEKAAQAAGELLRSAPARVFSVGFAGALEPGLDSGDLALDLSRSDPALAGKFIEWADHRGVPVHRGTFWSGNRPLLDRAEKRRVAAESGALVCEMEGQAIFEACRAKGVPFCAVRTVSDRFDQNLPPAVLALGGSGRIGGSFLKEILLHPGQWPDLWRLARSSRKAEKNLSLILKEFLSHA